MKKILYGSALTFVLGAALLFSQNLSYVADAWAQNVPCSKPQGGASWLAGSGCIFDGAGQVDVFVLDADNDTTISSPTDDQIDVEISGADDFSFTANSFNVLTGSVLTLDGVADALELDLDGDTTISAPTDDQIDIEIAGADDFTFTANTFDVLAGSTLTITGNVSRASFERMFNNEARVGATAGWVLGAVDTGVMGTVAASQTAGTLVIPISGLHVGDTITGFKVHAQVESGGNTVTIDGDLRNIDNTAADPVDASIQTMTQVSVTADTAVAQDTTGISHVVLATDSYYILLTVTTGAATDIQLINVTVTVTQS